MNKQAHTPAYTMWALALTNLVIFALGVLVGKAI